jgi:hypothetical protein
MIFEAERQGRIAGNTELGVQLKMQISLLIMKCTCPSAAFIIQTPEDTRVI